MNDTNVPQEPRKSRKKSRTSSLLGGSALSEALSIARDAKRHYVEPEPEINWTRDPLNEREATLRGAIICRVEAEARIVIERGYEAGREVARLCGDSKITSDANLAKEASSVARHVAWRLECLVTDQLELDDRYDDDYTIGNDLWDRIEHWKTIEKENDHRSRRLEGDRLLREAKLDV